MRAASELPAENGAMPLRMSHPHLACVPLVGQCRAPNSADNNSIVTFFGIRPLGMSGALGKGTCST